MASPSAAYSSNMNPLLFRSVGYLFQIGRLPIALPLADARTISP